MKYNLSKIASSKWTELQIFSEDVVCSVLVFCYNLETANLKYHNPVGTGRKLNVHKTSKTSSERLMYIQFTSCVYEELLEQKLCEFQRIKEK